VPLLRAPAIRDDQNRRAARRTPRPHHHTDDGLGHRLRRQPPGRSARDRLGFTGGGNGTHQVYIDGLTDLRLKNADIVDRLVQLVEKKAAEIEAAKRTEKEPSLAAAQ
jgi:hypothetical protein